MYSLGPEDVSDIDYSSKDSFLVHWYGFIDRESGISLYLVALAKRCLSKQELYDRKETVIDSVIIEVAAPKTTLRFPANFTGKRYVSVVAVNNAMEPSESACSHGLVKNTVASVLHNVSLVIAKLAESIIRRQNMHV